MYNRYIPQPDGSYRRSRIPDPIQPPRCPTPEPQISTPQHPNRRPLPPKRPSRQTQDTSIAGFLQKILPRDFDTGDLMIVILLLLISGDCVEEQNTALLTLMLYFFM